MMYLLRDNPYINERNMFYTVLLTQGLDYEIKLSNGLTESQIIKSAIAIRLDTPVDKVDITLQNLYACVVLGNCARLNRQFGAIFDVLKRLLNMRNQKVLLTLPLLLGKIVQTKEMKPSWSRYYQQIVFATVYCVDQRSGTEKLILRTLIFMSNYLPFDMTIRAIYALLSYRDIRVTQQYAPIMFGLRLLNEVAMQGKDKLTYTHVRTLEPALLKLIGDERVCISKWSTHVLEKIRRILNVTQTKQLLKERTTLREQLSNAKVNSAKSTRSGIKDAFVRATPRTTTSTNVGLSESEIVRTACVLTPDTMPSSKELALKNLSVCLACGNCTLANKNFRTLLQMLLNLLSVETYYNYAIVLNVIERILRAKTMKRNWSKFLREILLKIITAYGRDEYTTNAIGQFMARIAYALPLKETLRIVDTLIATSDYPYKLCAMMLLCELLTEQADGFTKISLDCLLQTLIHCIDHPRRKVRLAALFLIKKLSLCVDELDIAPLIRALSVHNKNLHHMKAKIC